MSTNGLNPLSYLGVNSPNPSAQTITKNTNPTVNDSLNFTIGDIWINQNTAVPNTEAVFMLTALNGGQATWVEIGATANVLNVLGGTNITVNTVGVNATINLNPSVVLAGSLQAGTTITAGTGLTVTTGNLNVTSGNISQVSVSNNDVGSTHQFLKSHNNAVVQVGDDLGTISFLGYDGAIYKSSAFIGVEATGTIGVGRVPSVMAFFTGPDAIGAPIERLLIDENGSVVVSATDGGENAITAENLIETSDSGFKASDGSYTGTNTSVSPIPSGILFEKSRAGGVIVTGDGLGTLVFSGNDGAADQVSALISVDSTGTIAAGRIPSTITFSTTPDAVSGPLPRVVIDENGTVSINAPTAGSAIDADGNILINDGVFQGSNDENNGNSSSLNLLKSRAGGIITTGDDLGIVQFFGDDGTGSQISASILVNSTGTIAAGRVPSRMTFSTTPDAVSGPLDRVVITQFGSVLINATTGGAASIVASDAIVTTSDIEGGQLIATNDTGGSVAKNTITNGNVANVPGGGALTIDSQSANPGTQAGFIKIYVGAATAYIPYFTNIAP